MAIASEDSTWTGRKSAAVVVDRLTDFFLWTGLRRLRAIFVRPPRLHGPPFQLTSPPGELMIHKPFLLAELPDRQPATLLLSHPLPPRTLQRQISTHDSLLKQSKIDRSRLPRAARWRSPDRYCQPAYIIAGAKDTSDMIVSRKRCGSVGHATAIVLIASKSEAASCDRLRQTLKARHSQNAAAPYLVLMQVITAIIVTETRFLIRFPPPPVTLS